MNRLREVDSGCHGLLEPCAELQKGVQDRIRVNQPKLYLDLTLLALKSDIFKKKPLPHFGKLKLLTIVYFLV